MKADATAPRTRFTVDLSDYPDLVASYLGLRVNSIRGLLPALEFGPKLKRAMRDNPLGLLRHEFLLYSLYPLHLGIRQYWQNFESLERWARSSVHADWWKNFVQDPTGRRTNGFGTGC